jgi:rod shape-determining protein MreD
MWIKYIFITVLFYLLAILQNSFFAHFNLFGATPNLVFIFFLLIVFFEKQRLNYIIIFYASIAGLLLDIFSSGHIGVSMVLLIMIGLLIKKIHSLLSEKNEKYSFIYFFTLFLFSFIIYKLSLGIYFYFSNDQNNLINFDWKIVFDMIYNLFFASIIFGVYKKFFAGRLDNRQLSLFNK